MNIVIGVMSGPLGSSSAGAAAAGAAGAAASGAGVIGSPSGPIAGGAGSVPGAAGCASAGAAPGVAGAAAGAGCEGAGCASAELTMKVSPSINPAAAATRAIVIRLPLLTVTRPITTCLPSTKFSAVRLIAQQTTMLAAGCRRIINAQSRPRNAPASQPLRICRR